MLNYQSQVIVITCDMTPISFALDEKWYRDKSIILRYYFGKLFKHYLLSFLFSYHVPIPCIICGVLTGSKLFISSLHKDLRAHFLNVMEISFELYNSNDPMMPHLCTYEGWPVVNGCRIKTGSGGVCCHNARGRVRNRKSNPDGVAGGIWRTVRTSPSALWQQTPTDRS